jgi:hypothetical protein
VDIHTIQLGRLVIEWRGTLPSVGQDRRVAVVIVRLGSQGFQGRRAGFKKFASVAKRALRLEEQRREAWAEVVVSVGDTARTGLIV